MSEQGTSDDQQVSFGDVQPPRLFDEQPTILIFDRNGYMAEPKTELKPFHDIVDVITNENNLNGRLNTVNQLFTVASVLPQWYHPEVLEFVQRLLGYPRVCLMYLFYIDVQLNNIRALAGNRVSRCFPITSKISARVRHICAKTNDLNIAYCERLRSENEKRQDIGVANLYARQKDERLALQLAYNEQIRIQFEEQLFQ